MHGSKAPEKYMDKTTYKRITAREKISLKLTQYLAEVKTSELPKQTNPHLSRVTQKRIFIQHKFRSHFKNPRSNQSSLLIHSKKNTKFE